MLHMAAVFFVIGLIAALLGFTTIAGASIAVAKFLAGLFLLLFLVFLIIGMSAARRIMVELTQMKHESTKSARKMSPSGNGTYSCRWS